MASSFVWAFPKSGKSSENSEASSVEQTVQTSEQLWKEVQKSVEPSETAQSETSEALSNLLEDLSDNSRLTKQQLSALISQLEVIEEDFKVMAADSEAKDKTIEALAKKANSVKFFVNAGGVIGFKNSVPTLGAVGNFGIKLGNGMQFQTGVQYQFITLGENRKIDLSWDLDKLSIAATVGYEW